jgi:thiamine transport system substrate-binding protein
MFSYSKKLILYLLLSAAIGMWLTGCQPAELRTLTILTHDSFSVSEKVLQQFEADNRVKVAVLKSGDAGEALNKVILTDQAPMADLMFGVDNTYLTRALNAGVFDVYKAKDLAAIPVAFQLDSLNRLTPIDYGDVCLNYDRKWFADHGLVVPTSLEDLAASNYKDMLVMENPATSSTGLAFLLATVAHFGPQGFAAYWEQLRTNGVQIEDGWNSAYYTDFSGSSGKGARPMVVSYASSPPAEMIFAEKPLSEPPTASIVAAGMCFRQIEFVGILNGTKNRDLAEKFIDFMLSKPFQEDIPLQMFMFPVRLDAVMPDAFQKYAQIPSQTAALPAEEIAAHRDEWVAIWTSIVLGR